MIDSGFAERLAAARAGEAWAVEALWHDLHPRILRFLRGVDPRHAEDLASETWLRIARDLGRFDGTEPEFRAWVFTIARYRWIDGRRRGRRDLAVSLPSEALSGVPAPDDPAKAVEDAAGLEAALALVRQLPPDLGEVILLRVVAGLDVAHVARIVGKRPGTVRVLQHRGLQRLAARLGSTAPLELRKL